MKILIGAGIAVIAIAGTGTVVYMSSVESATVNITIPAFRLDSWSEVRGAPSGGQFQTHRAHVSLTETTTGTATGAVSTGGTYATGFARFNARCVPANVVCTISPSPPGAFVCRFIPTGGTPCYTLLSTVSCYCGEPIPIRAQGLGSWYNAPPNSLQLVSWNPNPNEFITPYNQGPITGGTDGTVSAAVTQADIDAASSRARAQLTIDLQSDLLVAGSGLVDLIPDGAPQTTVTANVAAGARTKTFQVTASGTLGATEFKDSDAQALIAKGIDRWVPHGFRLNGAPVVTDFQVLQADPQGNVTVSGEALDYLVPMFSLETLRSQLRGVSVGAALRMIETAVPGSEVDIRLAPIAAPMLPLEASRISIALAVRLASAS